jgi:hypothetical protein
MSGSRKTGNPNLSIEIGAFVTCAGGAVGSAIALFGDPENRALWFALIVSVFGLLLCIPLLVSAIRHHPTSPHDVWEPDVDRRPSEP